MYMNEKFHFYLFETYDTTWLYSWQFMNMIEKFKRKEFILKLKLDRHIP